MRVVVEKDLSSGWGVEVERFFNLRRRIKDDQNIKDNFIYEEVRDSGLLQYLEADIRDLGEQDVFALIVLHFNLMGYGVVAKYLKDYGWDKKKVYALAKNEEYINSEPLFDIDNLFLRGKGYFIDESILVEVNRQYEEYLWHDASIEPVKGGVPYLFEVDIPGTYKGVASGYLEGREFILLRPKRPVYQLPNWPFEGQGLGQKRKISFESKYLKRWKIL